MEKVVSGEHGDKQNNVTEDRNENGTSNDLVDNADIEGPVFADVQKETGAEELSSTKMVTEVTLFPSMCVKRKNKITEKKKTVKSNLETKHSKWWGLAGKNFCREKMATLWKFQVPMLIAEDVIQETSWE